MPGLRCMHRIDGETAGLVGRAREDLKIQIHSSLYMQNGCQWKSRV
jgi:hypothetical protein